MNWVRLDSVVHRTGNAQLNELSKEERSRMVSVFCTHLIWFHLLVLFGVIHTRIEICDSFVSGRAACLFGLEGYLICVHVTYLVKPKILYQA